MTDGQNFFDQTVKNDMRAMITLKKTATGQGDDYITRILLDYLYFNEHCKLIGIE